MTKSVDAQANRRKERQLIMSAMADGWSMNQDIEEQTGLKKYQVAQHLVEMLEMGLIVRKRKGVYHLAKEPKKPVVFKPESGIVGWLKSKLNYGLGTD